LSTKPVNVSQKIMRGQLEVACFNAESARRAVAAGAHRIELCVDRASGGVTPSLELLKDLRSQVPTSIPINVMIRPRGEDFIYDEEELHAMASSIETMKPHCNGFVFGVLNADKTVDVDACKKLVDLADPTPCTFHRAFDDALDLLQALEEVIVCGFKTILTSGGPGNAVDNIPVLSRLLAAARGRIIIMPGGGLRVQEMAILQRNKVKPYWYHTSGIVGDGEVADEMELRGARVQAEGGQVAFE
jgi:copper homeostasis protein